MQNWFWIALLGPLLWSFVNHLDKYILFKYFKTRGVESLMVFSCLSGAFVLPISLFFSGNLIFDLSIFYIFILIFCGILSAIGFYFYLRAMDLEEVSVIIPLFQLLPVFSYFLGYFILGETLNLKQILFALIILFGAFILSLEIDIDRSFILKKKALLFVAFSCFSFALYDVLFKKIALTNSFWISAFWQYAGLFFVGLSLVFFNKIYRKSLIDIFYPFKIKFFLINLLSEFLYILGNLFTNYATLLAPVVLVLVVGSYQPLFTFIIALFMTVFLPKIVTERISKGHILHRVISIAIILVGSYLFYTSSN